jgi:hypothetical protein
LELSEPFVLDTFASPFIDDDLFVARLGGSKQDPQAVRRYLSLPVAARPEVSWFFDSAYHLQRYPDIQDAGIDPLIHFMNWRGGATLAASADRPVSYP